MCLDQLKNFKVHKKVGYKVVKKKNGRFHTKMCGKRKTLHPREWLNADDWNVDRVKYGHIGWGEKYPLAWHIFVSKRGAINWRDEDDSVVRVKFRKVVAKGVQYHNGKNPHIVVAQEMMILGEV